jgi:hypothetical protein
VTVPVHYRVDLGDANVQLGIVCLKTMVRQLRFNICKLEDSRLANTDVRDLESVSETTFPTPCSIVLCIGQIISALFPTIAIGTC